MAVSVQSLAQTAFGKLRWHRTTVSLAAAVNEENNLMGLSYMYQAPKAGDLFDANYVS